MFTYHSYAKINLGLHILNKRPDGYHDIETVMQTVDLRDTLTLSSQPEGTSITCTDPSVPTDARNLVARAVTLIRERTGITAGVRIDIQKRIPVAAGLAGGSGNGSMTLHALNHVWHLGLSPDDLRNLAARLGSDTVFCLYGGTAVARGRGELLETVGVECPGVFVLVNPPCTVSTAWAYQHVKIKLTNAPSLTKLTLSLLRDGDVTRLVGSLWNDFEQPVFEAFPVVERVKRALMDCGAVGALMSGSGPTVFGVTPDLMSAQSVAARVQQYDPRWRVFIAPPVTAQTIARQWS